MRCDLVTRYQIYPGLLTALLGLTKTQFSQYWTGLVRTSGYCLFAFERVFLSIGLPQWTWLENIRSYEVKGHHIVFKSFSLLFLVRNCDFLTPGVLVWQWRVDLYCYRGRVLYPTLRCREGCRGGPWWRRLWGRFWSHWRDYWQSRNRSELFKIWIPLL